MTGRAGLVMASDTYKGRDKGNAWWWFRLVLATVFLCVAATVAWRTFVDHAVQIWNSPAALIILVISIEFAWFISHVPDGGVVAWLKIVLGACALLGALPGTRGWSLTWLGEGGRHLEPKQMLVALLAAWVVADGVRDRRQNLRRSRAAIPANENPPRTTIAASSPGSER